MKLLIIALAFFLSACATTQPHTDVVYVEKTTQLPLPPDPRPWAIERNTKDTPLTDVARNWAEFKEQSLSYIEQLERIIKSTHENEEKSNEQRQ